MDRETARQKVAELVKKYTSQAEVYEQADYNEARTRLDFINPLFKLLGWDMDNEKGLIQYLREVLLEDRVSVDGRVKHPDYSFRLGNTILFYVEAKKPSVSIKNDSEAALQLRHYGWNTGLTLSLVTNFREFAVYDCRVKPDRKDKAHVARLTYFTCQDLVEKQGTFGDLRDGFDFLWDTFTQENVSKGSFEKYIKDDGDRFKRGVVTVDKDFLQTLEVWRIHLAQSLCRDNKKLTEQELNFIVPEILNRIIFLRMAESRGIEPYGELNKTIQTAESNECYKKLYALFQRADEKYNSGLFKLDDDNISEKIIVANQILKTIIGGLYENSPYAFDKIPVEILGSVYERFLGSVITLSPRHTVKVETKPEVRKAGGVYYTPQYIVDSIVKCTVDPLLKDNTPQEVAKIKILDPACGSGSFLLGAYQRLLDWHTEYYKANCPPSKGRKTDPLTPEGQLTATEKKKILCNNIFGTDIDPVAVEVTKLSLLIKCMEGETTASIEVTLRLFREKILPNIDGNICCGNSLVDFTFIACELRDKMPSKDFTDLCGQVKMFDWKRAFPTVFKQGGFDVIIGNPPYVKEYTNREVFENVKRASLYLYYQGKMDLCYFFVCLGIDLLKKGGQLGFIIPNNWTTNSGASILRNKIATESIVRCMCDFGSYNVFDSSSIQTMILILEKNLSEQYTFDYRRIALAAPNKEIAERLLAGDPAEGLVYLQPTLTVAERQDSLFVFEESETEKILKKILEKRNFTLDAVKEVAQGIVAPQDFLDKNGEKKLRYSVPRGSGIFCVAEKERRAMRPNKTESKLFKPFYTTEQLGRFYGDKETSFWIIYTPSAFKQHDSMDNYPHIKEHLDKFKKVITSHNKPYGLHRAREESFFQGEKIISLRKCACPVFTYTDFDCYVTQTFFIIKTVRVNQKYLTAILNSRLVAFWLRYRGKMQGLQYQVDKEPLLNIPLVDTDNKVVKKKIISLVDDLLQLYPRRETALMTERKNIENSIFAIEDAINKLVYQIYGLTAEEIAIIEGNT